MIKSTVFLAAMLATIQVPDSRVARFGTLVITDAEVAQITRLSESTGKRPHLILGFRSMVSGAIDIDVFLEPDIVNAEVQRGRILKLVADSPPLVPERSAWRLKETRQYACIALPGRQPFEIGGAGDLGWPFIVDGQIDDATLMTIVAFIRSRPALPNASAGALPQKVEAAPISAVDVRRGDDIIVALRSGPYQGSRVTLVRRQQQWVITHYESWIA